MRALPDDEPVITYLVQTPADARRLRRNRVAVRGVICVAFVAALLAPSPFNGDDDQPSNNTVSPTVVEVTSTSPAPLH